MSTEHPHSHWQELLPLYAMRALPADEHAEVDRHVRSCAACRRELTEIESDLALLAEAPGPKTPPPRIRRQLLRQISDDETSDPLPQADPGAKIEPFPEPAARRPSPVGGRWLAAAAALLLVVGGLWIFRNLESTHALRAERDRLAAELSEAEAQIEALEEQRITLVRELHTLRDPSSRHVLLAGLEAAPEASGRTVVSPAGDRARFYAFGLPELPETEDYELWLIVDGRPMPAGVFDVGADGRAEIDVEVASLPPLESIQAWAVTVEPAGGVPQPTGAMVLKG